ncbi:hypothetical protein Tco_1105857 [Tanacetum coccineum]
MRTCPKEYRCGEKKAVKIACQNFSRRGLLMWKFEDLPLLVGKFLVDKALVIFEEGGFSGEYESDEEDWLNLLINDMASSMSYEMGMCWHSKFAGKMEGIPRQDLSHELQAICDNLDIRVRVLHDNIIRISQVQEYADAAVLSHTTKTTVSKVMVYT